MAVKIGKALKALDSGKWIRVPAKAGEFELLVKQILPGERFEAFKRLKKDPSEQDIQDTLRGILVSHVIGWRGLQDEQGNEIEFSQDLLKDLRFSDVLLALTVEDGPMVTWLSRTLMRTDAFTEDADTSFLSNT
jgi:hypothetical protein